MLRQQSTGQQSRVSRTIAGVNTAHTRLRPIYLRCAETYRDARQLYTHHTRGTRRYRNRTTKECVPCAGQVTKAQIHIRRHGIHRTTNAQNDNHKVNSCTRWTDAELCLHREGRAKRRHFSQQRGLVETNTTVNAPLNSYRNISA